MFYVAKYEEVMFLASGQHYEFYSQRVWLGTEEDHTYAEVRCHAGFVTLEAVQNKLETV